MDRNFTITKALVGASITKEQLQYVDSHIYEKLSIYTPIGGACGYATSPNHTHPSYMFLLSYDSETTIMIEGRGIETSADTLLALSPCIEHSEIQHYLPPKYAAIFIDKSYFESLFLLFEKEIPLFFGETFVLQERRLYTLVNSFILEAESSAPTKEIVLSALAIMITDTIIKTVTSYKVSISIQSNHHAINQAIHYINRHFDEDISIEMLAKMAGLSKSHFSRLFSKEMQLSPMEYLKRVRLQHAKKLLRKSKFSITTVALECGFNSTAYFSKLFKEHFQETPKAFTKRVQ